MSSTYSYLFESDALLSIHRQIDANLLSSQINNEFGQNSSEFGNTLNIAANLANADFFHSRNLDDLSRGSALNGHQINSLNLSYHHWKAYIDNSLSSQTSEIALEDLIFYVSTGLLSNHHSEVRTLLRHQEIRNFLGEQIKLDLTQCSWDKHCEKLISFAYLFLVRQENREDINCAHECIKLLIEFQKSFRENSPLSNTNLPRSTGFIIIGLYHLAQSLIRTSEFLLSGIIKAEDGRNKNFESELRLLLTKAEELIEISDDAKSLIWLRAIGSGIWSIYSDSIWVQASGLSSNINAFISELTKRENSLFSLLPSQQEALKSHLLDPAQIAVVLQMPTSAGKTLLAEFSILQTFEAYKDNVRALFITPTKALCTQTYKSLSEDFRGLNIPVELASSAFEEDPYESSLIASCSHGVIISTPEKVDLYLRSHPDWFNNLKLIVIDEAHLLKDSERGVRLELLIANLRREQPSVRFLLLTPFVQNADQIAKWLGGDRGAPINIHWRPSRLMVGLAKIKRKNGATKFSISWKEPHSTRDNIPNLEITTEAGIPVTSAVDKLVFLNSKFEKLGLSLGMFTGSKTLAETAASRVAGNKPITAPEEMSSELKFAIALAEVEYGEDSTLANCLRARTAFHHASLSSELRYLIEVLARNRELDFLGATTTLAQGINFPVASVLIHSIHKPMGKGALSPSEFWNIAGRAGRVGLADKGNIVFVNHLHSEHLDKYVTNLSESLTSALLAILGNASAEPTLKSAYRNYPQLRPFIQYLAHAAARLSPAGALENLEELIDASLASSLSTNREERRALRSLAHQYLNQISNKSASYLKMTDSTGFSSFSFDEIFAKISDDPILQEGPDAMFRDGANSLRNLMSVLAWVPELSIALENGYGDINIDSIARVVAGWISGQSIKEISQEFHQGDDITKVRNAGAYIYSVVSQTISWGAHAYIKGWMLHKNNTSQAEPNDLMLPAYIQHGVSTPEAAVASLLGLPRVLAPSVGNFYKENYGELAPGEVNNFRTFLKEADDKTWNVFIERSRLVGKIDASTARSVWRRMRGL